MRFRFEIHDRFSLIRVVPSKEEIDFVLEVLDVVGNPVLEKIHELLDNGNNWDSISRNDFCR